MESFGDFMLKVIGDHSLYVNPDEPMCVGKVTSVEPIIIEAQGIQLYANNLSINPRLLAWEEEVEVTTSTNLEHTHSINVIHHKPSIKIGSYVLLYGCQLDELKKDYQKYHVICEVV